MFFDLEHYKIVNKLLSFLQCLQKTIVVIEKQVYVTVSKFDLTQYKIVNKLLSIFIHLKKTIVVIENRYVTAVLVGATPTVTNN